MKTPQHKGFAILISVIIMSTVLLIVYALSNISLKELQLSTAGRDSQVAFYAADTGMECALFWDTKNTDDNGVSRGYSAFSTSTPSTIYCAMQAIDGDDNGDPFTVPTVPNPTRQVVGGGMLLAGSEKTSTSTFYFITNVNAGQDSPCAIVRVAKRYGNVANGESTDQIYTTIISRGYNTCDITNPRRIERAVKATY